MTILVIIVAVLIIGMVLWRRRDVAYAAVLILVLVGIYIKQSNLALVTYTAAIRAVVVTLDAVLATLRGRRK